MSEQKVQKEQQAYTRMRTYTYHIAKWIENAYELDV